MDIRETIKDTFLEILSQLDAEANFETLEDDVVLLQSGLDSLGFAILIANLEDRLDYDPFTMIETPTYPKTFGELVSIYEELNPQK